MTNNPLNTKTKILIVEHDANDIELLQYELKMGGINFTSEIVKNERDYGIALKDFEPDVILSDYSLPSFDGLTALKIREQTAPDTPFIFVSGTIGEEKSIELIKNGLTDYVLKDRLFTLNTKVLRALKDSKENKQKKKTAFDLAQSEKQLAKAQQVAHFGSWELVFSSKVLLLSDEACRIYGIPLGQNRQSIETLLSFIHPDDAVSSQRKTKEAFDTLTDSGFNFRFIRTDGIIRHGYAEWKFEYNKRRKPVRLYGTIQDITERRETEEKISKANRLYAFINQINQNIVHIKSEKELFGNSCAIAIEFGRLKMAWIGLFYNEQKKIILINQCGVPDEEIKLFTRVSLQNKGPQSHVLETGMHYICNDIENDPQLENWKLFASKYGIRSCMVLPIRKSGIIIGTFNLYAAELDFATKEEIELLVEMSEDISLTIDTFANAKIQKETEKLVAQNEKLFRSLIEKSSDIKILSNEEGKIIYVSPSITKILGYVSAEFLSIPLFKIIHPEDMEGYLEKRNKILLNPGQSFYAQLRFLHKNGNWIMCEGNITNMLREPGIHALVSNFSDISEIKKMETQRKFDENNLNALINNTKDLMWSVDKNFNLITSNKPFDIMGELSFGKTISKGSNVLSSSYTIEMLNHFKQLYGRAFVGEVFTEIEHFDSPVELWTEISYSPIKEDKGVVGAACHSRDITERKRTEQLLRKSEEFNRGVLHSLSSHIAVINAAGTIVAVNEAWNQFALQNGETALQRTGEGSNYFDVCIKSAGEGDGIAAKALQGIKEVMDQRKSIFYLEYPCHSPNEQRWFVLRVMKFESDLPMVVVAHEDITELKRVQQERDNTLTELEHRVDSRTKELVDKNRSITDSINYAKRIQVGLMSNSRQLAEIFSKSFILFLPRDIVSGDFFWCFQRRSKKFIVVADCTGHGVPAALMSIIGNNLLNHIVIDEHIENPSEILELLDSRLSEAVRGDVQEVKDGMDIALCVVDTYFNEVYFAGAYRPLFLSDGDGKIKELPSERFSIGGVIEAVERKFETKRFPIIPGQHIYLSSDGYYSQFGGANDKKFMKSRFKNLLQQIESNPIDEQKEKLQATLTEWMGTNEQVDDVMVVGIEL